MSDDPDPATRYDWLTRVAAEAGDANEHLRNHLVQEFDAGRSVDGGPYYIAVTAALNAAANAGAFLADPDRADERDPVTVDRDSYALAVMAVARFLDVNEVYDA